MVSDDAERGTVGASRQQVERTTNPLVASSTVVDTTGNASHVAVLPDHAVKRPGKVPFEKGFSQMDWLTLCRKKSRVVRPRDVTMAEVSQHNSETDGWTVIDGKVYEISQYLKFHPGGAEILRVALGKDCTKLFRKFHAWVNYEMLLNKFLVGYLVK